MAPGPSPWPHSWIHTSHIFHDGINVGVFLNTLPYWNPRKLEGRQTYYMTQLKMAKAEQGSPPRSIGRASTRESVESLNGDLLKILVFQTTHGNHSWTNTFTDTEIFVSYTGQIQE